MTWTNLLEAARFLLFVIGGRGGGGGVMRNMTWDVILASDGRPSTISCCVQIDKELSRSYIPISLTGGAAHVHEGEKRGEKETTTNKSSVTRRARNRSKINI